MTRSRLGLFGIGAFVVAAGCGDDGATTGAGGGTTTSSTSTTAGVTVTSGSGGGSSYVGLACDADSTCGPGGKCIKSTDDDPRLGGGPAGGYCTISCSTDDECDGGLCLMDNGVGECFLGCDYGTPAFDFIDTPLEETKCHGREDLRCQPLGDSMTPVCLPTCGQDSQCDGRSCDPRYVVCVNDPNTGFDRGAKCDPMAADPECAGVCVNFSDGPTMCSNRCVLGGTLDGDDCGGLDAGLCVFRPTTSGIGDYGFCTPSCTQHDDCQNPDFWCFDNTFSAKGYCFVATACPGGQADCVGADNEVCTDTKYGPFCLDPYPLGSAGTGGGGTGGGGTGGAGGAGGAGGGGGTGGTGGN